MHDAGRADAQAARLPPHALPQAVFHRAPGFADAAAVSLDVEQAERGRRLMYAGEHVGEEGFVLALADAQPRLGHEVAVRQRRRQLRLLPLQDAADFLDHDFQCGVVAGKVVGEQLQQPAPLGTVMGDDAAQHRRLPYVEPVAPWAVAFLQLGGDVAVLVFQLDFFELERGLPPDHLHRFGEPFPVHGGAQDVVPPDDGLQRAEEAVKPLACGEAEQHGQQVGIALFVHEVVEQDAFLQRGQRVDVGDVGGAARYGGDEPGDLRRRQGHQREHVGCQVNAACRDAVGRHVDFLFALFGGQGQGGDSGGAEEAAHVGLQSALAHPLDQFDGQ